MKGVLSMVLVFILMSAIIISIFFVANPLLLKMNSEFSKAGEDIINSVELNFTDNETYQSYLESVDRAKTALPQSSEIISYSIKYSWLIFLAIVGSILYIFTRKMIEIGDYNSGGGIQ